MFHYSIYVATLSILPHHRCFLFIIFKNATACALLTPAAQQTITGCISLIFPHYLEFDQEGY